LGYVALYDRYIEAVKVGVERQPNKLTIVDFFSGTSMSDNVLSFGHLRGFGAARSLGG
jgi:hypothetical protein